jgi:aminopeptidase N
LTDAAEAGGVLALAAAVADLCEWTLDSSAAPGYQARVLQLPAESWLAEQRPIVEPAAIRAARQFARAALGRRLAERWSDLYARLVVEPYRPNGPGPGRRALRNLALGLLVDGGDADALLLARTQLEQADSLTDRLAALIAIVNGGAPFREDVLAQCARRWQTEPLLMNKWFNVQATAIAVPNEAPVLERVRSLMRHRAFSLANPNSVYALVLGFCAHNPAEFHRPDGSGYAFWVEQVLRLDALNPTVAARVARALDRWRKFTPDRARAMRGALREVARAKSLSRDVREIVSKSLVEPDARGAS